MFFRLTLLYFDIQEPDTIKFLAFLLRKKSLSIITTDLSNKDSFSVHHECVHYVSKIELKKLNVNLMVALEKKPWITKDI